MRAEREHANDVEAGANAAVGKHGHAVADRVGDRRQRASGRRHAVELAAAVVGDDDAVGAESAAATRILGVENALDDQRTAPLARMKSRSRQVTVGSKLLRIQAKKSSSPVFLPSTGATLPRLCGRPRMPTSHAHAGRISACQARRSAAEQPGRASEAGAIVAIARAGHRHVDGEHQRRALRRRAPARADRA